VTADEYVGTWTAIAWQSRSTTGPGLIALAQLLRNDRTTPPALRELARRFLESGLYREDRPRARATDPATSRDAAEKVKARGPARPGGAVHRLLRAYSDRAFLIRRGHAQQPLGMTSREVETVAGVRAAHKRTSELLQDGLLEVVQIPASIDGNPDVDVVRDGGRVLRITDAGRTELARLDAVQAARA
jgi:hypothetical protein